MGHLSSDASSFLKRHIGPNSSETQSMLLELGLKSLDELAEKVVPENIRMRKEMSLPAPQSESSALKELEELAQKNKIFRSYIGLGYYNTHTPSVIRRNILENPSWYTQYTPYQPEISQGRLEALFNFQTMVCELTGFQVANASLLDEATAAAEVMTMFQHHNNSDKSKAFFVSQNCNPQTIAVVKTRAKAKKIPLIIGDEQTFNYDTPVFGVLFSYCQKDGLISDVAAQIKRAKEHQALVGICCDLLALCLLKTPFELGADVALGNSQRFGIPLGNGGPHAAFLACKEEFARKMPGRVVGVSKDASGKKALRLALQTREQHIRRERATSNICTAQALLAIMASMYGVYHGSLGLRDIASSVAQKASALYDLLKANGIAFKHKQFFDTLHLCAKDENQQKNWLDRANEKKINLQETSKTSIALSLDETVGLKDLGDLSFIFLGEDKFEAQALHKASHNIPPTLLRAGDFMQQPVFKSYHSETEIMRYIKRLERRDYSLCEGMIPLGSCTMKLNAASELEPVSWAQFANIHPFADLAQMQGYETMISQLRKFLAEITGFFEVSIQPNSGAQGEFSGLNAIKNYHEANGEGGRNICLIPQSAHGTNPATAAMLGYEVQVVRCANDGNIDLLDLKEKLVKHGNLVAAFMITYPSTHGVFETQIKEICDLVHATGAQVYLDGANLNAQLGLCRPGDYGADVCHINLHKTFCIPHGGGGPGVGPIAVAKHLAPFLPGHELRSPQDGLKNPKDGAVAAAPWGSAGILPISYMYIRMMGAQGLKQCSLMALLNANYLAKKLSPYFPILYTGENGFVAHECLIDLKAIKQTAHVDVLDIAKRLMDYGFHSPTVAFPVANTMMIEPTESESKGELDRFCEAMRLIRAEIDEITANGNDPKGSPLKNAPHTEAMLTSDSWDFSYSREKAAFPYNYSKENKFWPYSARIDDAYGDRNLICTCEPTASWS